MKIAKIREGVLSLLFPRHCPVCHRIVLPKGELLCPGCRKKVPFTAEPTCFRCGKPIPAKEAEFCYDCTRQSRSFVKGFSLTRYDRVMRESILAYKNKGRIEYADWYAGELADRMSSWFPEGLIEVLVPVPLHPKVLRKRGYNQAEEIALRIGKEKGIPVAKEALVRKEKTKALKYLSAVERKKRSEKSVGPGKDEVRGKRVLLIDDVFTTGTTAENCTKVLLTQGAREVYVVTIAIGGEE